MNGHPLDRAVLHALESRQSHLSIGGDHARRFLPDVSPFAAIPDGCDLSVEALSELVRDHGPAALLQPDTIASSPGLTLRTSAGVQMVANRRMPDCPTVDAALLGQADVPEMRALAALTEPGPFLARTHILGDFYGVREGGRLIAMAGERLKLAGYTEVSGVCTHPDRRGRGLAGALTRLVAGKISARGETPFLHAYATNAGAIRLYETLGFTLRSRVTLTIVELA